MEIRRAWGAAALLLLCGTLAACASGGAGRTPSRSSRSPITREEIGDRSALDLYTLVEQLRPNWLRTRGQTSMAGTGGVRVAIDGTLQAGGVDVLRSLRGAQVREVSFLSGQDATTRYGLDVGAGVIAVTTERGGGGALPSRASPSPGS